MNKSRLLPFAGIYFLLSTAITWWFIDISSLYDDIEQKLLSCSIAGGKWMIQIVAGYTFLKNKNELFLNKIGLTCLIGSLILLPYCLFGDAADNRFFLGSLIASVVTMIFFYQYYIRKMGVSINWFFFWFVCLAIAITLQLTIVFKVF
jgi:hypothetical protein